MALSTPPTAPQRGDRATFASRVDAFITWLIGFVSELNIFSANLNSLAAGGAYAIPYTFTFDNQNVGTATGGMLCVTSGGGALLLDTKDQTGTSITGALSTFGASTSAVKGTVRIQKVGDPSKWLLYSSSDFSLGTSFYGLLTLPAFITGSAGSTIPFVEGDAVMLFFQRTGDKGDTGAAGANGTTPGTYSAKISHRIAGTTAGNSVAGANTRSFNTVENNTITGASLSSNTLTLPAGTYRYWGRAPGYGTGYHTCYLYNSSGSSIISQGSTGYNGVSTDQSDSIVSGYFTLATQSGIQLLQNFTNAVTNGLGLASNTIGSSINVYAELTVEKLS